MSDPAILNFQPGDWCAGNRYAIVRLIARGGMAEVYEAFDLKEERRVAVKVSQLKHQQNDRIMAKMAAEARAFQQLRHPNLVRVFEAGLDRGTFYFVMELLEGESLRDILWKGGLDLDVALAWVADIADGVHYLNEAGIVHRDLKPENILLTGEPGTPIHERIAKVLDLGVAKFKQFGLKSTAAGGPMGTAAYMSPEHIRGDKGIDRRADVYALGLILSECVAGKHPFIESVDEMPSFQELTSWQLYRVPDPLTDRGLPVVVSKLVEKPLEKERDKRYASAAAFAKAIRGVRVELRGSGGRGGRPVASKVAYATTAEAPIAPAAASPAPPPAILPKRTARGTEMILQAPPPQAPEAEKPAARTPSLPDVSSAATSPKAPYVWQDAQTAAAEAALERAELARLEREGLVPSARVVEAKHPGKPSKAAKKRPSAAPSVGAALALAVAVSATIVVAFAVLYPRFHTPAVPASSASAPPVSSPPLPVTAPPSALPAAPEPTGTPMQATASGPPRAAPAPLHRPGPAAPKTPLVEEKPRF